MNFDDLRTELRRKCDESLYFFLKAVIGYHDMTPELHGPICQYLQSDKQFKLLVLPRGHLKSSCATIGRTTWKIVRDPNLRVLLANATSTNASHFLKNIGDIIQTNAMLQWLYPEVIPDFAKVTWSNHAIELKRPTPWPESTVESIGVGGTVVSRHYDMIVEDDLIAPEDGYVTADLVAKVIDWHKYATSLAINPSVVDQMIVGTRWLYDDFIAYLFQNEKWFLPAMYKSVYSHDGTPIWPQRFTADVVDRILEQQGPRIFSCQYMNDPVHEDARSFDMSWMRYYTKLGFPIKFVMTIDPAISQKKHGDYTGIVVLGATASRDLYVVHAEKGRWGIDEMIDRVFAIHRMWPCSKVGLETVMFQKALMWPFREAMRRENVRLPLVEMRPSSKITKEARIQSLHEYFANGSMWLNKAHTDLLDEIRGFPAIAHDDLIDALSYAVQLALYPSQVQVEERWSPLSFEAIMKELNMRRTTSPSPWLWHNDRPAPVLGGVVIPQTAEEIFAYMKEGPYARQ